MILPDVNVVVSALREEAAHYAQCRVWLEAVLNGDSRYGMSPQVLSGAVRILTHRSIFDPPTPVEEALRFCASLMQQPHCVVIGPGPRHWEIFSNLCIEVDARGNMVPDAWFAALAIEAGCEWITLDRDFARFKGLRWSPPG